MADDQVAERSASGNYSVTRRETLSDVALCAWVDVNSSEYPSGTLVVVRNKTQRRELCG